RKLRESQRASNRLKGDQSTMDNDNTYYHHPDPVTDTQGHDLHLHAPDAGVPHPDPHTTDAGSGHIYHPSVIIQHEQDNLGNMNFTHVGNCPCDHPTDHNLDYSCTPHPAHAEGGEHSSVFVYHEQDNHGNEFGHPGNCPCDHPTDHNSDG